MVKTLICIPSELPGGLEAELSKSLEGSDVYNFVEINRDANSSEISLAFQRYSCHAVACLDPIEAIAKKGAAAIIVRSISPDNLLRFLKSSVRVLISKNKTVQDSARQYINDKLTELARKDLSTSGRK